MEEGISLTYRSCSLTTSLGTSEHETEFASSVTLRLLFRYMSTSSTGRMVRSLDQELIFTQKLDTLFLTQYDSIVKLSEQHDVVMTLQN